MTDVLVRIPGPVFLLYFPLFTAGCIVLGWLLLRILEGAGKEELPPFTQFTPSAFSYLRGGMAEVVQTAVFSLWHKGIVEIAKEGAEASVRLTSADPAAAGGQLTDPAEQEVRSYLLQTRQAGCSARKLLRAWALKQRVEESLSPMMAKLRSAGILRTGMDHLCAWGITLLVLLTVVGIGGTKLYFGIMRMRPVEFLIAELVAACLCVFIFLKPYSAFSLFGRRYVKKMQRQFAWTKKELRGSRLPEGIEPAYLFAFYGIALFAGMTQFNLFYRTFASQASSDSSSGFSSDSSGGFSSSDSSGGCGGGSSSDSGGGCGGCGGGD